MRSVLRGQSPLGGAPNRAKNLSRFGVSRDDRSGAPQGEQRSVEGAVPPQGAPNRAKNLSRFGVSRDDRSGAP